MRRRTTATATKILTHKLNLAPAKAFVIVIMLLLLLLLLFLRHLKLRQRPTWPNVMKLKRALNRYHI